MKKILAVGNLDILSIGSEFTWDLGVIVYLVLETNITLEEDTRYNKSNQDISKVAKVIGFKAASLNIKKPSNIAKVVTNNNIYIYTKEVAFYEALR